MITKWTVELLADLDDLKRLLCEDYTSNKDLFAEIAHRLQTKHGIEGLTIGACEKAWRQHFKTSKAEPRAHYRREAASNQTFTIAEKSVPRAGSGFPQQLATSASRGSLPRAVRDRSHPYRYAYHETRYASKDHSKSPLKAASVKQSALHVVEPTQLDHLHAQNDGNSVDTLNRGTRGSVMSADNVGGVADIGQTQLEQQSVLVPQQEHIVVKQRAVLRMEQSAREAELQEEIKGITTENLELRLCLSQKDEEIQNQSMQISREREQHERKVAQIKQDLTVERMRSDETKKKYRILHSGHASILRGLGLDKDKIGQSEGDIRSQWEFNGENFVANFGGIDAEIDYEAFSGLAKDLGRQMNSIISSASCDNYEWLRRLRECASAQDVFRVFGAMLLVQRIFETPFPSFDRVGCQKCVAYRDFLACASMDVAETIDIATEYALYENSYTKEELVRAEAESCVNELQGSLTKLAVCNRNDRSDRWTGMRRESYVKCISSFLELRMKTVLKREWFEVRWVAQGDVFNPDTMVQSFDVLRDPSENNAVRKTVKLCLFPALWRYDAPNIAASSPEFSKPRVLRKSFVPSPATSGSCVNSGCVGRALVSLN